MEKRKAKLKEIFVWYKFRPRINVWFEKSKGKSFFCKLYDETWYDGYPFNCGCFIFIQLYFCSIHIKIDYFIIKMFKS